MKYVLIAFLTLQLLSASAEQFLIDTIEAVVSTPDGVEIITRSDLSRKGFAGEFRSKDDIIHERLVYCDAKKWKIGEDPDAIDRYIATVIRENHMTQRDIEKLFESAGYSYQEGREQLQIMQVNKAMIEARVISKVMVSHKDIEKYWNMHPELQDTVYELQIARVPVPYDKSSEQLYNELMDVITLHRIETLPWSDPFMINEHEMAENVAEIKNKPSGYVTKPQLVGKHFEIIRLRTKRSKTIDDYYEEIANFLRRPKYEELLNNYYNQLMDSASIVYFNMPIIHE